VAEDHIDRIVAEWGRERPDLDVRPVAAVGRILRAARYLERLESEGFVSRQPDPHDGRGVVVRLTEAGRRLQEEAFEAHLTNEEELLGPLDEDERAAVGDALRRLLAAFEAGAGRARPLIRRR
jgi:hypothetical protein